MRCAVVLGVTLLLIAAKKHQKETEDSAEEKKTVISHTLKSDNKFHSKHSSEEEHHKKKTKKPTIVTAPPTFTVKTDGSNAESTVPFEAIETKKSSDKAITVANTTVNPPITTSNAALQSSPVKRNPEASTKSWDSTVTSSSNWISSLSTAPPTLRILARNSNTEADNTSEEDAIPLTVITTTSEINGTTVATVESAENNTQNSMSSPSSQKSTITPLVSVPTSTPANTLPNDTIGKLDYLSVVNMAQNLLWDVFP